MSACILADSVVLSTIKVYGGPEVVKMAIARNSRVLRTINFLLIPGSNLSICGIVRTTNSDDFS